MLDNRHRGTTVDSFLESDGTLAEFRAVAIGEVASWHAPDVIGAAANASPPQASSDSDRE